jgi:hypothetical protein
VTKAILLCALVWGFLLYSLRRGYRHERRLDRHMLLTWTVFVGLALVFIFRIPAVQPAIDSHCSNHPVTFTLSLLALLAATTAYSVTLKYVVHSPASHTRRHIHLRLIQAGPGIALAILVLMTAHLAGWLSAFRVQYLMKWLVEGYGMLQSALVFVPVNWQMYRREQVFPMRIKHLTTSVLTATFAISGAFSVIFIPLILLTGRENPGPYLIPRAAVVAVCLAIILVPHRWLALLLLPHRLRRYARLTRLEGRLSDLVMLRRKQLAWQHVFRLEYVEMAIYLITINILDNYQRADRSDPFGCELYAQIQALLSQSLEYDDLVETICCVKI